MPSLAELESALVGADRAGDAAAAQALAAEIQRQRQQSMTHQPGPRRIGTGDAILAGLNSRADKIADGLIQMGADEPVQRGLKVMKDQREARDAPIQREYPIAFGFGDSLPLMAIPGGQATAAGRILAPAIGGAIMEGLSYGSPAERAKRAAVAGGMGAAGGTLGEGLSALLLPRRGMPGLAPDVADAVQRNNFPLTASQRSGSATLSKLEDYLSTAPGAINRMQGVRDQQQDILNRLAARSIGQNADSIDQGVLAAARTQIGAERGALQAGVRLSPVHPDLITGVRNARQVVDQLASGPQSLTRTQAAAGASVIDDMENFIRAGSPMDGQQYQTWRTALREAKEAAYEAKNSRLGKAYDELQKSLDRAAQGAHRKQWRLNDQQYAALENIEKGIGVNEATGNVNPRTLANNFMRYGGSAAKEGKLEGPLADLALLAKGVPEHRPGSPTAQRQAWQALLAGGLGSGAAAATGSPLAAGVVLGIPVLNNALARAVTRQGAGLGGRLADSPILTEALREQIMRGTATGLQGLGRGTAVPGLAVPP